MYGGKPSDIDEYISRFPGDVQAILQEIRRTVHQVIPDAVESIKYDIPTFILKGNLLHFAAYKNHIGFYPVPKSNPELLEEIRPFIKGKGTLQFLLKQPIPFQLISKIINELVIENLARNEEKKSRR